MSARIPLLDHGYIQLIETWGSEERIVEAARMSTGKGFLGWGEPPGRDKCSHCGVLRQNAFEEDGELRSGGNEAMRECVSLNGHKFVASPVECLACGGSGKTKVQVEVKDGVPRRRIQHKRGFFFEPPLQYETVTATCAGCGGRGTHRGDEKLLKYMWEHDHGTPFEMAGATFEVQAPIFVFREWHRHRVPFGYNELSARYTPMPNFNYLPTVERCLMGGGHLTKQAGAADWSEPLTDESALVWLDWLDKYYELGEGIYQMGLSIGIPKELARLAVTVGRYSRMRATGNLRGWVNFLRLRAANTAQWEIRQFAQSAAPMLASVFPHTLRLFSERNP